MPQEQTVITYKLHELPEHIQEKVFDNWKNQGIQYAWSDEWIDSLKEFGKITGVNIENYEISPYSYSNISWEYSLDEIELAELKGLRLRTWLINNWIPLFEKGKYYSTNGLYIDGKYHYKFRRSNCTKEITCPLTGFCGDISLIQPILDFIDKPRDHIDLETVINNCMNNFIADFNADCEYQDSNKYIEETIEANDYNFTADGEMF